MDLMKFCKEVCCLDKGHTAASVVIGKSYVVHCTSTTIQ